jgi:TonB family protein
MMAGDIAANLVPWALQVTLIAAAASLLPWLFGLDAPGVRYTYWRTVAVLCLALPWIQPYRPDHSSTAAVVSTITTKASAAIGTAVSPSPGITGFSLTLVVLALGAAVRFGWLSAGLIRLRRLRRHATRHPIAQICDELRQVIGTHPEVRYVAEIEHPITFGLLRPIVLLPERLRAETAEIQRAVLGHELLHVKRRDWAWLIVEEIAVCLFWFHPASWWLASEIQRSREEVVDELAILVTGRRKSYVEALVAFSDATSVLPTAAFARRRHLFRRIALVSKESVMSSQRIVATCAAMAMIVGVGSWYAVGAFPLRTAAQSQADRLSPGPLELKAHQVTPENPIPRRIHFEPPVLPDSAPSVRGSVGVQVTLDDVGRVAEARVAEFTLNGPDYSVKMARVTGGGWNGTSRSLINSSNAKEQITGVFEAAVASVRQWRYDPPAEAPLTFVVEVPVKSGPEVMEFKPRSEDGGLRVGGDIKAPKKIKDVRPVYPPIARQAGIAGVVIIETKVGADGFIEDARVLRSIPLLDEAALDAVKQWQFEPPLVNGQPTAVTMTVTVNFYAQ